MQENSRSKEWIGLYHLTFVLSVKLSFKLQNWQNWKYHHRCKKVTAIRHKHHFPLPLPELYSTFSIPHSLYHSEGKEKWICKIKHISSERKKEIENKKYIGSLKFLHRTKVNTDLFPFQSLFLTGLWSTADLIHWNPDYKAGQPVV